MASGLDPSLLSKASTSSRPLNSHEPAVTPFAFMKLVGWQYNEFCEARLLVHPHRAGIIQTWVDGYRGCAALLEEVVDDRRHQLRPDSLFPQFGLANEESIAQASCGSGRCASTSGGAG